MTQPPNPARDRTEMPLLPCPFCGGEPRFQITKGVWRNHFSCGCKRYGCPCFSADRTSPQSGPALTFKTEQEAVDAWNTRTQPDQPSDESQALYESAVYGRSEFRQGYKEMRQEWMGERKLRQEAEAKIDDLQKRLRSAITAPQLLSAENESRARALDVVKNVLIYNGQPFGEVFPEVIEALTAQPPSALSSSGETSAAVDLESLKVKEIDKGTGHYKTYNEGWNGCIDFLASQGHLVNKTPADIIHNETCERSVSDKGGGE